MAAARGPNSPRARRTMTMTRGAKKQLLGKAFTQDALGVVLEHLSLLDGINLLKTSKSLYYCNDIGAAWICKIAGCPNAARLGRESQRNTRHWWTL